MNLKSIFIDWKRNIVILADLFCIILTFYLAFWLRFMDEIPFSKYLSTLRQSLPVVTVSYVISFFVLGIYRGLYRYASINDLLRLFKAVIGGALLSIAGIIFVLDLRGFPRSIFIIHPLLVLVFAGAIRLSARIFKEELSIRVFNKSKGDDNLNKINRDIHGVKVLGSIEDIPEIVKKKNIDEIIITTPSATREEMRRIIEVCNKTHLPFRTTPSLSDIIDGQVSFSQIRNVEVKDLLSREVVKLDLSGISNYISGKRVLVTGAGGSIGSEICRQLTFFKPELLIFFARGEFSLYKIINEFREKYPLIKIEPVIANIRDRERTRAVLGKYRPGVIFHTAAHKHVFLMETNPCEAIKNNVMGTRIIMEAAEEFGVERFVLISTDKAVNPTSFMGASKRIAELLLQAMAKESRFTKFSAVRFGNVLESRGSVVPLFKEQIKKGKLITLTHPEATRYFMTLSEAAQLVIQAGAIGKGGEIFVLDMGEQIKIIDLARDLIRLSGFEPDVDIKIKIIGLRPGEKLHEELVGKDEKVQPTSHEKIMVIKSNNEVNGEELKKKVEELEKLAVSEDVEGVVRKIKEIVPEFNHTKKAKG